MKNWLRKMRDWTFEDAVLYFFIVALGILFVEMIAGGALLLIDSLIQILGGGLNGGC